MAQQKLYVCLGFATQREEGREYTTRMAVRITLACFMSLSQAFVICHISKVFGSLPAWDRSSIRHHFLQATFHLTYKYRIL